MITCEGILLRRLSFGGGRCVIVWIAPYGYRECLSISELHKANVTRRIYFQITTLSGWILHHSLSLARQFASLNSWTWWFIGHICISQGSASMRLNCGGIFDLLWVLQWKSFENRFRDFTEFSWVWCLPFLGHGVQWRMNQSGSPFRQPTATSIQ